MNSASFLKYLLLILVIAFLLNVAWENAQTPLFGSSLSFRRHLVVYTMASFFDALYTVGVFLAIAIFWKNRRWTRTLRWPHIAFIFLAGFGTAVLVERWALHSSRWGYSSFMPLIPLLDVGLFPVLELMLLPLATFLIARQIAGKTYY